MTAGGPEPDTAAGAGWGATERWIGARFAPEDEALGRIRRAMESEGLPSIQLPVTTARVLHLLLRSIGARRVLEVGTLAGYSALWIARALPGGGGPEPGLLTLERDPDRAELARRLLREAGVGDRVEVRVGEAAELLAGLPDESAFDAVFLDADKEGLPGYLEEARRLLRPGGLLLVDNALWKGRVVDPGADDAVTMAIRAFLDRIASGEDFDGTLLPVGDGLLMAIRR